MNESNPHHVKAEETIAEAADPQAAAASIFRDMMSQVDVRMGPGHTSGTWGMVEAPGADGEPVPQMVLMLAQNNTVNAYFFTVEDMGAFMQGGAVAFQALQGQLAQKSPLLVAGAAQMEEVLRNKHQMDSQFGQRHTPDWPPKNGRYGV